jgi:hypothetical protein
MMILITMQVSHSLPCTCVYKGILYYIIIMYVCMRIRSLNIIMNSARGDVTNMSELINHNNGYNIWQIYGVRSAIII